MFNRICGLLLLVSLASLVTACGGGAQSPAQDELRAGALSLDEANFGNPGVAGQDYTTQFITVGYVQGAQLPAHLRPTGSLPGGGQAGGYAEITQSISQRLGLAIASEVYWITLNMAAFEVPEGADGDQLIADIQRDYSGLLVEAHYSRLFHPTASVSDPWYNSSVPISYNSPIGNFGQWGQQRIGCDDSYDNPGNDGAWDITFGSSSVRIAVCDTGARLSHEALNETVMKPTVDFPALKLNVSAFNPSNHNNDVTDNDGHGTFIAGLIAAKADSNTMIGVAPSCPVVPIKISNSGATPDFNMYEGCEVAVNGCGAKVVNLSWGGDSNTSTLTALVNDTAATGALLVIAAGNEGDAGNPPQYPAAVPGAFAVGSSTVSDTRSGFSNHGAYLDVAAPGQNLVSCGPSNNSHYYGANGTSFAAPIVAAVAGLMWSVKPGLTHNEIRQILVDTGRPTTGFSGGTVPRIDAAAAVKLAAGLQVNPPALPKLLASGTVTLTPEVAGLADRVEAYFNGVLVQSLTSAPWDFQIDTTSVQFGKATVEFRGFDGAEMKSASVQLAIDNTGGTYPLLEDFELPVPSQFLSFDAKYLGQAALDNLYSLPGGDKPADLFRTEGPASWNYVSGGRNSAGSHGCTSAGASHGAYEVDALISRKLTVPAASQDPTLVFYHKYNLEKGAGNEGFDRGWILATEDGGLTFAPAKLRFTANDAWFSGNQPSWWKAEVDLSSFGGKTINLVFCLQSDGATSGEVAGAAGWWIDQVTIATDYNESVPMIGGVSVSDYSVFGAVPSKPLIGVEVQQPTPTVNRVTYFLDCLPLGDSPNDIKVNVTGNAPWQGQLELPDSEPNQLAQLRVQYYDSQNVAGPEVVVPLWIFNQPGDVNADGVVNQLDLDAFPAAIGLAQGDPGFVPFFDTDLDGKVRENDAAAIGYFWGN